ncbi:hypothetical protein GGR52DRAFT_417456 [Hypoxylon sp. FL1284]|nr:hypothetical protein GGR52DRAFT_417456 [Hypoxylon sp. FL1284]
MDTSNPPFTGNPESHVANSMAPQNVSQPAIRIEDDTTINTNAAHTPAQQAQQVQRPLSVQTVNPSAEDIESTRDRPAPVSDGLEDAAVQSPANSKMLKSPMSDTTLLDDSVVSPSSPADGEISMIKPDRRLPILQSLGWFGCAVIIGGSILLLPVIGFLLFLWAGGDASAGGQDAPLGWRKIMLSNWAVRSITLSALVLRVITAAQATVCTSLTAALLIERRRMPASKVALLSIFRGVNDGPLRLFKSLFWSKPVAGMFHVETLALVLLTLASLAIQFASTILLSDVTTATLVQLPQQIPSYLGVTTGATDVAQRTDGNALTTAFGPYATFGERETTNAALPDSHGVSDTGLKERAFLPFDRSNRTILRSFEGPTVAITTRVSCIAPTIEAPTFSLFRTGAIGYSGMTGNISYGDTFQRAGLESASPCVVNSTQVGQTVCYATGFSCSIGVGNDMTNAETYNDWPASLCRLPVPVVEIQERTMGGWHPNQDMWTADSDWPFLTFATNARDEFLTALAENGTDSLSLKEPTTYGEWSSYEMAEGIFMNVTLCTAGVYPALADVRMTASADPREPDAVTSINSTGASTAEKAQDFLGETIEHRSPRERGLLSIDEMRYVESNWSAPPFPGAVNAMTRGDMSEAAFEAFLTDNMLLLWEGPALAALNWGLSQNLSLDTCSPCSGYTSALADDSGVLFTRVVDSTGRAAPAVDALLFHIASVWYYRVLPLFDRPTTVQAVFSGSFSAPTAWAGLVAVLAVLAVHLLCVWAVAGLYVARVRYTRQGNVWHAVAQLLSPETRPMLDASNEMDDDEVLEKWRGRDAWVSIGRSKTGRVEVMPC